MADPLGGGAGDPRAPTINTKNVDGGPLEGYAGDPGAPTINIKNTNNGPPERWYRRSGSVHHQHKKMSMAGPLGGSA
jgi:hypothetical protein